MSRHAGGTALAMLACGTALAPAGAQTPAPQLTAEDVVAQARAVYMDPLERERIRRRIEGSCPPPRPGEEIVVCATAPDDPASAGYDAESAERDYAAKTANKGAPRAPGVETQYPGSVAARGCFIPPCPPPMPKLIDLKAIPEPAADSDAALIARGEKAR